MPHLRELRERLAKPLKMAKEDIQKAKELKPLNDLLDKSKPISLAKEEELSDEFLKEAKDSNAKL